MNKRFFNMIPSPDVACILLYGEVGDKWEGVTDADIVRELRDYESLYGKIDVRINSIGGSVYAGIAIFNALRESKADITIYVDGVAASIASVIAMCGKPVYMSQYARLMIHNVQGGCWGNKEELKQTMEHIEQLEETLADIYSSKTGTDREEIKKTYFDGKDHWLTAKEAKDMGFVDGIYDVEEAERQDVESPDNVYRLFMNRMNNNPLNNDKQMFEELKKRPLFANCADSASALAVIGTLENKAGKYDTLKAENDTLRQKLKGFEDAAAEARRKEIDTMLENAVKEERIRPADKDTYRTLLEKDFENASKILEGLPRKKMISDGLDKNDPENKGAWEKEQENIRERRYGKK
jgi:ATP-dependent Clp endopeptidase proteolytic subunit ClpP